MSASLAAGDALPPFSVLPDRLTSVRYAGASGDFNPIHVDEAFARSVGLPGSILHGLWTMAQVARAQAEGAGVAPDALRALSVEFRGMAVPGEPIEVASTVEEVAHGEVATRVQATQAGRRVVRNGRARFGLG